MGGFGPRFAPSAVAAGVVAAFVASLVAAALVAIVVYATPITEQAANVVLFGLGLVCLGCGAAYGARMAGTLGWVHGVLVGLVYVGVSLILAPLAFSGGLSIGGALQRLVLGAGAGALGGVLGVNL